jgi:hypothetical protein
VTPKFSGRSCGIFRRFTEMLASRNTSYLIVATIGAFIAAGWSPPSAFAAVSISSAVSKNISCSAGVCTPTAADAVLNATDLTNMLASSAVSVNTGGALASDIAVKAGFSWASANALTLDAYRSITVEKAVSDSGTASLTLLTDDGGSGGVLSFSTKGSISFLGTENALSINGNAYTLENSVASLASAIAANPSGFYALANNYDASVDGTYTSSPILTTLTGKFEGLGNTVTNLAMNFKGRRTEGALLRSVGSFGSVSDVRLVHEKVRASKGASAAGLVGDNAGAMSGDSVTGSFVGIDCGCELAGLTGYNEGTIVASAADVRMSSAAPVAGFVGENVGTISLSRAGGSVATTGTPDSIAAGFVDMNRGFIDQSFATVSVVADENQSIVGGFAADDEGMTTNSYATGAVTGGDASYAGGMMGYSPGSTVQTSYSTGLVSDSAGREVGGFIGYDDGAILSNNDWDTTTSGTTQGTGEGNKAGLTGLTTQQLQAGLPVGFDKKIWAEKPNINGGLPYLIANPPPQ